MRRQRGIAMLTALHVLDCMQAAFFFFASLRFFSPDFTAPHDMVLPCAPNKFACFVP